MTIEHIKKTAKNLKRLLPDFLAEHASPYALTAVQQLVCNMNGYPNMEVAATALDRHEDDETDLLGSFYRYPWLKIEPNEIVANVLGSKDFRVRLSTTSISDAVDWFEKWAANGTKHYRQSPLLAVVAAGNDGAKLVDKIASHDDSESAIRIRRFGEQIGSMGFATLSQEGGLSLNWFSCWSKDDARSAIETMIRPACSYAQFSVCTEALHIVLGKLFESASAPSADSDDYRSWDKPAHFDIDDLLSGVESLLPSEQFQEFSEFDNDDDSDKAKKNFSLDFSEGSPAMEFLDRHTDDNLHVLLRPLHSLLSRLSLLGSSNKYSTTMKVNDNSDESLQVHIGNNLTFVTVNMGSKLLDHVMAMAVLAKFSASTGTRSQDGFRDSDDPEFADVVLITR